MRRAEEVVFKVSDRGRGIAAEALERVFDRFESQTSGSRHRGPGLGLSIVRALVELHGGRVTIESVLGEGTVVTCIFPIKTASGWPSRRLEMGWRAEDGRCAARNRRARRRGGDRGASRAGSPAFIEPGDFIALSAAISAPARPRSPAPFCAR